jgi:hypothetical protein
MLFCRSKEGFGREMSDILLARSRLALLQTTK